MNCLIWVLLLLCCENNGSCFNSGRGSRRDRNDGRGRDDRSDRSGNERQDDNDCDCGGRTDFRSEPRFEQRPFVFNQNAGCGCEEQQNNSCDR